MPFIGPLKGEENAVYLVPETLKAVRPSLCSVRGKRHSLFCINEKKDNGIFFFKLRKGGWFFDFLIKMEEN